MDAFESIIASTLGKIHRLPLRPDVFPSFVVDRLQWMRGFLRNAEKFACDKQVKALVADVACDAENAFEMFMLDEERGNLYGPFHNIAEKIDEIKERTGDRPTDDSIPRIEGWRRLEEGQRRRAQGWRKLEEGRRRAALVKGENEVVCFVKDADVLVQRLRGGDARRGVVSIVAPGGAGKTTLAHRIYKRSDVKTYFNAAAAWIFVNDNVTELLQVIAEQVMDMSKRDSASLNKEDLQKKLSNFLQKRRYLIVLDDMRSTDVWVDLVAAFPDGENGSRIMLTTRDMEIAMYADPSPANPPYVLPLLTPEESWKLFLKKAFPWMVGEVTYPVQLEDAGKQIVAKCKGLPLAIEVIGGLTATRENGKGGLIAAVGKGKGSLIATGEEETGSVGKGKASLIATGEEETGSVGKGKASLIATGEEETGFLIAAGGEGKADLLAAGGQYKRGLSATRGRGNPYPRRGEVKSRIVRDLLAKGKGKEGPVVAKGKGKEGPVVAKGQGKEGPVVAKGKGKEGPVVAKGKGKEGPVVEKGKGNEGPVVAKGKGKEGPVVAKGKGKEGPVEAKGKGKEGPVVAKGKGEEGPVVAKGKGKEGPVVAKGKGKEGLAAARMEGYVVDWKHVLQSLNELLSQESVDCSDILALSYYDLPCYLKSCLLYLGLFPKGRKIEVEKLTMLWVAEGFVQPIGEQSKEDVAKDYFLELIDRSMIQVVEWEWDGEAVTCCIHDLLLDFVIAEATKHNFFKINTQVSASTLNAACRLAIHFDLTTDSLINYFTPSLRSLLCFTQSMLKLPGEDHILLRVLDLEGVQVQENVLDFLIKEHIHLKYLNLSGSSIKSLPPSIGNLYSLGTLLLDYGTVLPETIWKMHQLKHLHALDCDFIGQPRLGDLKNLHSLFLSAGDWIEENSLSSLSGLRILQVVGDISSYSKVLWSSIEKLDNLNSLVLSEPSTARYQVVPSLVHHWHLYEMVFAIPLERLPKPHEFPPNLTSLVLDRSGLEEDPMPTLEKLTNLQILQLSCNVCLGKKMISSTGGFPQLMYLTFLCLDELEEWIVERGAMPKLVHLSISVCPSLNMLPEGLRYITTLKEFETWDISMKLYERLQESQGDDWYKIQHIPHLCICQ